MSDYQIVYTASDLRGMIPQLKKSLQGLSRFIDRYDIKVVLTPPYPSRKYLVKLNKYARIFREKSGIKPFQLRPGVSGGYGEKIRVILNTEARNVIFLDCDTKIKKDPSQLIEGDYELSARAASSFLELDINAWTQMFLDHGKTPIPMINTGFMIFKNYAHEKIMLKAQRYFELSNLPQCHPIYFHKDQYAISLAVSDHKIRWMTKREHAYKWLDENPDSVILHGERRPLKRQLRRMVRRMKNYVAS